MTRERWEPFGDMVSLRDAMNSLFRESVVPGGLFAGSGGQVNLPVDVCETENDFRIRASLPGIKPDDVQITVHGDTVTLRAEGRADEEKKGETWHVRERRHGTYQRSMVLNAPIDADQATAHFEHGVLTLTIPKSEKAKPKQIKISSGGGATSPGPKAGQG
jgi:HSP20 family protein